MMIELTGINKYYRSKDTTFQALKNVDLRIEDSELVAIQGKSGAGKSTLMHIIGCIDFFDNGKYVLDGIDIGNLNDRLISQIRNKKFGFVMQDFALIPKLTVYDNIAVPLYLGDVSLNKIHDLTEKAASAVGIYDQLRKKANQLSGGQKQRVAIARAIVNSPKIILADEPTGSLDASTAGDIISLLKKQNINGITVIIITHDDTIAQLCNKVIKIYDGNII